MLLKLILLVCGLNAGFAQIPRFQNAQPYVPMDVSKYGQNITSEFPLGFRTGMVPYPPNDLNPKRQPLVIQLNSVANTYIQVRVETEQGGAAMCVIDDDTGPDMCDQGHIAECYAPSKDPLKLEFYCKDSCQSSDVYFKYRVVVSEKGANDQWCANQPQDFPSNLLARPSVLPTRPTPRKPTDKFSEATSVFPMVLLTIINVIAAVYLE